MKIKVSFFAIMLLLSLVISGTYYSVIPIFAAILHELGHIFAAKARKVKLKNFDVGIFGARLTMDGGICSYADELIVCASGPLVNLILAGTATVIIRTCKISSDAAELFVFSSLCLGVFNLLPILSFDGGRILGAVISMISDTVIADKVVTFLSFLSLFTLWCISLYLLLRTSASLSLFVFSVSIFANIFVEKR